MTKTTTETGKTPDKKRPAYRINFAGRYEKDGAQKYGRSTEIGAAWPLDSGDGFRLRFNVVPQNLNDGAVFLNPVMDQEQEQAADEQEMENGA